MKYGMKYGITLFAWQCNEEKITLTSYRKELRSGSMAYFGLRGFLCEGYQNTMDSWISPSGECNPLDYGQTSIGKTFLSMQYRKFMLQHPPAS